MGGRFRFGVGIATLVALGSTDAIAQSSTSVSLTNTLRTDAITSTAFVISSVDGDLSSEGWLLRGMMAAGIYELSDNDLSTQSADLLIGYQLVTDDFRLRAFSGITVLNRDYDKDEDRDDAGVFAGGKVVGQLLSNRDSPYHVALTGSYATTLNRYGASLQVGLRTDGLVIGPEMSVLGSEDFQSYRLGVFVNGIDLGVVKINTEAGYSFGNEEGSGESSPYVQIGLSKSF